jgi:hypothetical protein
MIKKKKNCSHPIHIVAARRYRVMLVYELYFVHILYTIDRVIYIMRFKTFFTYYIGVITRRYINRETIYARTRTCYLLFGYTGHRHFACVLQGTYCRRQR